MTSDTRFIVFVSTGAAIALAFAAGIILLANYEPPAPAPVTSEAFPVAQADQTPIPAITENPDPPEPVAQPEPPEPPAIIYMPGLGWSLEQIIEQWGPDKGWICDYPNDPSKPDQTGYSAHHPDFWNITYVVNGPERDVTRVSVLITIPDEATTREVSIRFAAAAAMVCIVSPFETEEVCGWIGDSIRTGELLDGKCAYRGMHRLTIKGVPARGGGVFDISVVQDWNKPPGAEEFAPSPQDPRDPPPSELPSDLVL